jgi:hypothetical protein
MKLRLVSLLALTCFTFGCVSAPPNLDTTKPIEFSESMWEPSMRQNGVVINEVTAMDELEKVPGAEGHAQTAKALFWTTAVTAGVGGWFLGAGLAGKDHRAESLGVSAGFIGLSFLLAYFQKNALGEATDIYNSNLKPKKKASFEIEPTFSFSS